MDPATITSSINADHTDNFHDAEDSLCDGEFEIINDDEREVEGEGTAPAPGPDGLTSSLWSVNHSINLPATPFLNSMVEVNTLTNSISQDKQENAGNDSLSFSAASQMNDSTSTLPETTLTSVRTTKNNDETPVLDGTITYPSGESLASSTDSTLASTLLKFNNETKNSLEKTLASLESIGKDFEEKTELKREVMALKSEKESLEKEKQELHKAFEEMVEKTVQRDAEFAAYKQEMANRDSLKDNSVPKTQQILQQQLYEKSLQVDTRDRQLASLRNQLDEMNRRLEDAGSSNSEKEKYISGQLDAVYAKFLEERERRRVAEEQLRNFRLENPSTAAPGYLINEQMIIEQLQQKTEYAEQLELEVLRLKKELENAQKQHRASAEEVGNLNEIISVMREDHEEGTRLIVEKDQKISHFEKILDGLSRVQVDNI